MQCSSRPAHLSNGYLNVWTSQVLRAAFSNFLPFPAYPACSHVLSEGGREAPRSLPSSLRRGPVLRPILALEVGAVATSQAEWEKASAAGFSSSRAGTAAPGTQNLAPGWPDGRRLDSASLGGRGYRRRHQSGTCQHGRWRCCCFRGRPWGSGFRSSGRDRAGAPSGR